MRTLLLLLSGLLTCAAAQPWSLRSPDGRCELLIQSAPLRWSLRYEGREILPPAPIAMVLEDGGRWDGTPGSARPRAVFRSVRDTIRPRVPLKRSVITDHYNGLSIDFRQGYRIEFRAYDDGAAFRWIADQPGMLTVRNEELSFALSDTARVWWPEMQPREGLDRYHSSFEEPYLERRLGELPGSSLAYAPVLAIQGGLRMVILESNLRGYPGLLLDRAPQGGIRGVFAPYVTEERVQGGEFPQRVAAARAPHIARTQGQRSFPWRVLAFSPDDQGLLENDLVYRLADPETPGDWSWVKPGISTEEWICGSNLYGVDFPAGLNTETYRYYIDFAADYGLDFVMLDAGWSDYGNLLRITPGMDLDLLSRYAKDKGISLTLWTLSMALERQLDTALAQFRDWGVRCIMTDFMDRNDQQTVEFYEKIAAACARYQIMVMFHGAFPPGGFERTWPNAITREGALGSEYNIWSDKATPRHDLVLPFTRMLSGAMDYEPGFLDHATQEQFRPIGMKVMSQGTRTHQLAMFVVYDSPLQMFSGNPADGRREPAFMEFLGAIPTVWDETRALEAEIGSYLAVARRHGDEWYLAAMNDWTPRILEVPLDFLPPGRWQAEICADGVNAARNARDYRLSRTAAGPEDRIRIQLAPGGGFVMRLRRE
jgi:alpha-glucosidase